MNEQATRALEALRADGRRVTTARRMVVELLVRTTEHLTADDLAARIHDAHPEIHLSTVYRTLDSLCAWGLVEHVHQPHGASFFHLAGAHRHLVCEQCGRIRDVPAAEFDELVERIRSQYEFELHLGHAALVGRCADHGEGSGMHIPDGYLSPQTCGAFGAAMVPVWTGAARRVRKVVRSRFVPLVALGAAYCFLVMMFNVPIPDGTTAHAVGAVLVAVLLGPWAAVVAVSVALAIQALFFGDGGVLALAANCFNMAFVMPMVGYAVYRAVAGRSALTAPRRALAAGIGGYVGLNAAALCAAVELGIQPTFFHRADGTPLYAPFHLAQTIPAMMLAHLTVAGVVEFALTAGVVAYLQRVNLPLLRINHRGIRAADDEPVAAPRRPYRGVVVGLVAMLLLTPLGLLAPGRAFGEAAPGQLDLRRYHLDAVPAGLRRYAGFWHHALFNGYGFAHDRHPALGYLVSAFVGLFAVALVVAVLFEGARVIAGRRTRAEAA